ncbi:MAG: hypothetical protein AAF250_10880 [Pseudomonadota bacterium]
MTEEVKDTSDKLDIISLDDLIAADINAMLSENSGSDTHALTKPICEARAKAEEDGNDPLRMSLGLLHDLLNIHLRADDRAEPFGPMWQSAEGRTCTASDFRGEQTEIFKEYAPTIEHPVLRARIADITWYNNRKLGDTGRLAVSAYAEVIERRLAGDLHRTHGDDGNLHDLADIAQRMVTIAARLYKSGDWPSAITDILKSLFDACVEAKSYIAFVEVADIAIAFDILDWSQILEGVEAIVGDGDVHDYPMAIQRVWSLAEHGYAKLGDTDNQKRAQEAIVEQDLKMRGQVNQASAEAHWVRMAIDKLRQFGGNRDRITELRKELRDLEEASLDDFGRIPMEADLSDLVSGTVKVFGPLTLPDFLLRFAVLNRSQSKAELEKIVDEASEKYIMSSLFAGSYSDRDGKVYAQTGAKPDTEEGKAEWYKAQSLRHLEIHRRFVVGGQIEPARKLAMANFPLEARHFLPIVYNSAFVENGHHMTFATGFARFFQGDFISAANLLIPQLEHSLRYVLKNADEPSAKMMSDLTQDDRSLSSLLDNMREELVAIFDEDLVHEIDLLFNFRPGPALRHEAAHGKLTDAMSYSADAIYACWLIYQITCAPLVPYWKEHIAPQIEAEAF